MAKPWKLSGRPDLGCYYEVCSTCDNRCLRSLSPPKFKARDYKKKIDEYKNEVEQMLDNGYIGTRIFNELRDMGYEASLSTVHRYISEIRGEDEIKSKITTRIETPPGKQMQYDWKEWLLPCDGKSLKIYIHEIILSYSRKKYCTYSVSITTKDVIRAIHEAIDFFGGIAPELVIDNPKQMIITHERTGVIRYNDEFLRFCGLYGIEPNPCQNYRARTKELVSYYTSCKLLT